MMKEAFSTLAAAGLMTVSVAYSEPVAPPSPKTSGSASSSVFADVDHYLALSAQMVAELEAWIPAPANAPAPAPASSAVLSPGASCLETTSTESILRAVKLHGETLPLLVHYYGCLSVAVNNPAQCGPLTNTKADTNDGEPVEDCRKVYLSADLTRALIVRSPTAGDAAVRLFSRKKKPFATEAVIKQVALQISQNPSDPAKACSGIAQFLEKPPRDCQSIVRLHTGRMDCAALSAPLEKSACLDFAAFRKAFDSKDAALCADRALCRALMGGKGPVCRPLADAAKRDYCSSVPPSPSTPVPQTGPVPTPTTAPTAVVPAIPAEKQQALDAWLGQAHQLLVQLDAASPSGMTAASQAIESREERIAELRERFEEVKKKRSAATVGQKGAATNVAPAPRKRTSVSTGIRK